MTNVTYLEQAQVDAYKDKEGNKCPFCLSEEVTGSPHFESDGTWAERECSCEDCDEEWTEHFDMTGIEVMGSSFEFSKPRHRVTIEEGGEGFGGELYYHVLLYPPNDEENFALIKESDMAIHDMYATDFDEFVEEAKALAVTWNADFKCEVTFGEEEE